MAFPTAGSFTAASTMQSVETFLTHLQSHATDGIRVHEHLTSFQEAKQKINYLQSLDDADEREDERQCTTISAAVKAWPASGGFMLMTSDTKGAARLTNEPSSWHCICVLRHNSTLWVYDPACDPDAMPPKQRIGQITGLAMMKALWTYCGKHGIIIHNVRITGVADDQEQCIPLACLWMERMVLGGKTQWPTLEDCANWRELTK